MAPNIKKRMLVGTPMFMALIGLFLLDSVAAKYGLGGLPPLVLGWILISIGGTRQHNFFDRVVWPPIDS